MLVHDFAEIDVPCEIAVKILSDVGDEFDVWARSAYQRGERLALGPANGAVTASVSFDVGAPVAGLESFSIPVSWTAESEILFPSMEAELVLSPLAPGSCQLEFRGSYQPPLQGFGALLDKLAFHRVAQSTVRGFLDRLAEAVHTEAKVLMHKDERPPTDQN